jgi:hypothetical protein
MLKGNQFLKHLLKNGEYVGMRMRKSFQVTAISSLALSLPIVMKTDVFSPEKLSCGSLSTNDEWGKSWDATHLDDSDEEAVPEDSTL